MKLCSFIVYKNKQKVLIVLRIFLSLFITNLEIPIVTTSLVSITDDLNSFNEVNWIASAYMLGEVSKLYIPEQMITAHTDNFG